ncbi:MAG: DEAD/DEAH box helicase family protein [Candidatus Eisenbacteria bacterium]|jgi:type I restriction enzyme R subunit|nr:DEAD/DEAH box helicase family protein [Candidatus Eisenbacteria bacterium]
MSDLPEPERLTREARIDPRLDACGWPLAPAGVRPMAGPFRTEEHETANGPADYVLWLDGRIEAVVEAKRVTLGAQEVLSQAERYARGLHQSGFNFEGLRCPFLYSTSGEEIWFRDARHPRNRSRRIAEFHTPNALRELLARDLEGSLTTLAGIPINIERLWPHQQEANAAIEAAIADRTRAMLLAMATGTGKTMTMVSETYRLMKSGVAKRVLFLVDRRALAAQAVRAFAAFEPEAGLKFDRIYEVYSSRFHRDDFGEGETFDPKVMPGHYLTDPQPGHAFVYVCTIQRMAINILGRQAIFGAGDEAIDDDADRLSIPIHAFDVVIADECHRGYTSQELSVWRSTLDHFDAIKIGLTATPASHTSAYFVHKVFDYPYERAVQDGRLVDYHAVTVRSDVRMHGIFLREGDHVEVVDPHTGLSAMDTLEDERTFDTSDIETRITAPQSNRLVLEEVKRYADAHEQEFGRFPKTLIFAVNDLPHMSHADALADLARDVFGRGDDFVCKITGRVDRPLQRIREFRNLAKPGIAVTVDLLSTGVDIPDLEFIVFLRPVKSRILFEQMLGRGTRKGETFTDKPYFTVFDCFDGTLLAYFRGATGITIGPPDQPSRTIVEVIEDIWANRDREYNTACLIKRLHRIDRGMASNARTLFAAYLPQGDVARFGRGLRQALADDFVGTMKLLRTPEFQHLLVDYPRPAREFWKADEYGDTVTSALLIRDTMGQEYKPEDYLVAFSRFVRENPAHIEALRILLDRPRDWSAAALGELREKLAQSRYRFSVETLQKVHELRYHKALVDIISMVKHAADEEAPLLTAAERVERAFARLTLNLSFTPDQEKWLARIQAVMQKTLSLDREDFDYQPALSDAGGWAAARRVFGESELVSMIHTLNEAIAA